MSLTLRVYIIVLGFTLIWLIPGLGNTRERYEPDNGCYIGAFIENDSLIPGNVGSFESPSYTGKEHALYFTYTAFNAPTTQSNFPWSFAMRCKKVGAAIHLGWEPNTGWPTNVVDSTYLKTFARDCKLADMPVFLRFASEMNGNWVAWYGTGSPSLSSTYRDKWQKVFTRLSTDAPNAVMVWTPNTPYPGNGADANYNDCYPGDEFVQWVGVDFYDVGYHNHSFSQSGNEDPAYHLLWDIYTTYQSRKPIKVSEWAANHYDYTLNYDLSTNMNSPLSIDNNFAPTKIHKLYSVVSANFPRLKAIQYFDFDVNPDYFSANRDYQVTDDYNVLTAYRAEIASPYFLTSVVPRGMITYSKSTPFSTGTVTITLTTDRALLGSIDPKIQIETLGTNTTGYVSMSSTGNPLVWQYDYYVPDATSTGVNGFTDDYEDGSANDGSPVNWGIPAGWSVANDVDSTNKVLVTNFSTSTCVGGYDWEDYGVRVTGESQYSSGIYVGVILRYATSTSYYSVVLRGNGNQDLRLLKQNGGISSTLTTVSNPLSTNTTIIAYYPYEFRVECEDSTIRARVWRKWEAEPDYWMINFTDTNPITHGGMGLRTNSTKNLYDDIRQMRLLPDIDGKQIVHIDARDRDESQMFLSSGRTFTTRTDIVNVDKWERYK